VQLVGRWGDDRRLLEAAVWVERQIARPQNFPLDRQQGSPTSVGADQNFTSLPIHK